MKFEWITDWDTVWSEHFLEKWNSIYEQSKVKNIFFHSTMTKAWYETYSKIENIQPIFCLVENNKGTILFPLVIWKRNMKNLYSKNIVPCGFSVYDYLTPLFTEEFENWDSFWDSLIEELNKNFSYDFIDIVSIESSIAEHELFEKEDICPVSDISMFSNIDEFILTKKKNFRHTIKRKDKRLNELGQIRFEKIKDKKIIENYLDDFLKLHTEIWPNAYKAPNFHKNIFNYVSDDIVNFSIVFLDDKPISYVLGFNSNDTFYHYMSAYNKEFYKYSLGSMHIKYLYSEAIEKGLLTYDLLRGDESYKFDWTEEFHEVKKLKIVNNCLVSKLKMVLLNVKSKIK